jgi:hypothetical protein
VTGGDEVTRGGGADGTRTYDDVKRHDDDLSSG